MARNIFKSTTALALSLMLLCSFSLQAQKTVTVSIDRHIYEIDKNISLREAEARAIQSARIAAIQNAFGTELT